MRMIPSRGTVRRATAAVLCAGALAVALVLSARAQPSRTVTDGVYAAEQAARGGQVYREQCASCHGDALEGSVGPPLAGDGFLSVWSALPVVELVDKIHNTMPLQAAAPLSRDESIDLTAYILEAGGFPAGEAELADAALADIALPTVATASAAAGGGDLAVAPIANLAQLMRAIAFPASNIVFNTQIKDPGADVPEPTGTRPFDFVEWGGNRLSGVGVDRPRGAGHRRVRAPLPGAGPAVRERPAGARGPGRLAGVHCGGRRGGAGRLPGVAVARLGRRHRGHRPAQRGVRELPRGLSRRGRRGARGGCGPLPAGPLTAASIGRKRPCVCRRNPAERTRGYG